MWTDWQGTSPQDVQSNLAALKAALVSGQPVEIIVAGVKTRMAETKNLDWTKNVRNTIEELQYYAWKISQGWDWKATINPRSHRNRQTIVTSDRWPLTRRF